jgi:hypothetical protein
MSTPTAEPIFSEAAIQCSALSPVRRAVRCILLFGGCALHCSPDAATGRGEIGLADAQRFADPLDLSGAQRGGRSLRPLIKLTHRHLIDRPACTRFFHGNELLITDVGISLLLNKNGLVGASLAPDS